MQQLLEFSTFHPKLGEGCMGTGCGLSPKKHPPQANEAANLFVRRVMMTQAWFGCICTLILTDYSRSLGLMINALRRCQRCQATQ